MLPINKSYCFLSWLAFFLPYSTPWIKGYNLKAKSTVQSQCLAIHSIVDRTGLELVTVGTTQTLKRRSSYVSQEL